MFFTSPVDKLIRQDVLDAGTGGAKATAEAKQQENLIEMTKEFRRHPSDSGVERDKASLLSFYFLFP
jgi:hypothetical protein